MKRNLFKFVALNSLKTLCAISVVILNCAIISAQTTPEPTPKPIKKLRKVKVPPKPSELVQAMHSRQETLST